MTFSANPSTATQNPTTTVVDEAVRIATEASRRTTDSAQASLAFGRRLVDQSSQINRDLWSLWAATAEAAVQTVFDVQNAAIASQSTVETTVETTVALNREAFRRWADLTRQAQSLTLKTYQANARLLETLTTA